MATLRDIKARISSVSSTKQITNAMKMVAAAYLRKAQQRIIAARPYANHVDTMLRTLKSKNQEAYNVILDGFPHAKKTAMVIVTADRGLCGSFNTNIIRMAAHEIEGKENIDLICVGKRSYDYFVKRDVNIIQKYLYLFNEMDFDKSKEIAQYLIDLFASGEYSKIVVLYNEFKSAIQQNIIQKQILPVVPLESEIVSKTDYLYEPDADTIIDELGKKYVDVDIWRILLESTAAEQGARMTAMENATENAVDLIAALTLQFNRKRQGSITSEIIEISSGAEAINQ